MNEKINSLIKLQELDSRLASLAQEKSRVAPEREKIKADIEALLAKADEWKKALTQAQVDRKSLELDMETKEQAMRKSTSELNTVKSNDAYKALLSQIEDAKKSKSEIEDRVLELMEKIDQLQKEAKEAEKRVQQDKSVLEKQITELDAKEQGLAAEWDAEKKVRDEYFQTLPRDVQQPYENVQRGSRRGAVVVPIKANICGSCKTLLPPSVVNDVVKGKDLISCETCARILYIPAAPPEKGEEPAPQPAAS